MALDPKSKQDVQDTATYIEDTLRSVSAKIGDALKDAINQAFDGVDATVLSAATKDFTRSMTAAARASEDLVRNTSRISQGLLKSRDIDKQIQALGEKKITLDRQADYILQLANKTKSQIAAKERQALQDAQNALDIQMKMLEADKEEVAKIEKTIGLTGKLAGALSKVPGVGQFIDADKIDVAIRKAAASGASSAQTTGIAFKMLGKQLITGLADPLTYVLAIWNGFLNVNKASVEFQRLTGENGTKLAGINDQLATSVDTLEVMAEITKQVGISATSVFSAEDLGRLAQAKNLLGISAEQATNLGIRSKIAGEGIRDYQKGIVASTNKYNGLKGTTVAHGIVMQDVLSTSDDIALSLGDSSDRIATAATSARSLGLNLERVDQIAGSLMNFEDSISNELEAQLLTGKDINLSKAREYAMTNNLTGLSEELKKNGASAAEFAGMQRIEQESLAKALGMSRSELAKSVMMGETAKNLTAEQKAEAMGVTLEQMEQMDIQQRLEKSLDKLAQAFAPVLGFLVPLVTTIGEIIAPIAALIGYIMYPIQAISEYLGKMGEGVSAMIGPLGTAGTLVKTLAQAAVIYSAYMTFGAVSAGLIATGVGAIAAPIIAGIAAAAILSAGLGYLGSIKDGGITPDGTVLSGDFGSVKLDGSDKVYDGSNGKVKVGTDLFGSKKENSTLGSAVGNTQESTLAGVEAKLQELINVARQGTVVKIDGKEVARTVIKNTKSQAQSLG